MLAAGFAADWLYYQAPVSTLAAFFRENVLRSLSVFYGVHPWHWYVTQGVPTLVTVLLPWVGLGAWRVYRGRVAPTYNLGILQALLGVSVWTISAYSLLSHKEARFLQPLVPVLHLFAATVLAPTVPGWVSVLRAWPRTLVVLLLVQAPVTVYLAAFHAQGQVAVMRTIHHLATPRMTVGFLMPCHSTPWQSHMHARVLETTDLDSGSLSGDVGRAWFLACPPPRTTAMTDYWDQSDFFYHDPYAYLLRRYPARVDPAFPTMLAKHFRAPRISNATDALAQHARYDLGWRHPWPSHLVLFASLLAVQDPRSNDTVGELLHRRGYRVERRIWNALVHPEHKRQGAILVLRYEAHPARVIPP